MSDIILHCPICANNISLNKISLGPNDSKISCDQCRYQPVRLKYKSISRTLAFTLTALIFFIPANTLPFMTIELYGSRNSATIWSGVVTLTESGSWFIAAVVFLASIVVPIIKLLSLFILCLPSSKQKYSLAKTQLYLALELIGRWSMLDIFLLAVLVAIMKLGPWSRVEPEAGSWMFALVVIFTLLASASFDPRLLWKDKNEIKNT